MIRLFLYTIFLFLYNLSFGQSKTDFAKLYFDDLYNGSSPIKAIAQTETDFSDLEPIGKSIKDAKIVFLGEPSHGDGGSILMKTRLVKYLHEKKGFDVLLFEADLFSINFGISQITDTSKIRNFVANNIYTCWSKSIVSSELWRYINDQSAKQSGLNIGGIDCRHSGIFAKQNLVQLLKSNLEKNGYITKSKTYENFNKSIQYLISNEFKSKKDSVDINLILQEIKSIEEFIKFNFITNSERLNWLVEVNNLQNFVKMILNDQGRDVAMAENLDYLSKYVYPNKKLIVWSHNNHNVLDVNTYISAGDNDFSKWWYENNTYKSFTYLGADIYRQFGEAVYSLAIVSNQGNYSPAFFGKDFFNADFSKTAKLQKPSSQSLESYLENKKCDLTFIPLPQNVQGRPSSYPWFSSRLFDITYEAKMDYTSAFDGIIFINKTVDLNGH